MDGEIPALKIRQNERDILLFSMSAEELIRISYFNPRDVDREAGIQRPYQRRRSKEIAKYLDTEDAVLANDIIINLQLDKLDLTLEDVYNEKNKTLNLGKMAKRAKNLPEPNEELKGKFAFVIDGQHRLRAFEFTQKKDFPLIVAALINLSLAEVAEIFVKINYYQKPVNKSVVFDLLGISEDIFPQYYKLHKVVRKLNEEDIESPFYGKIKMLGIGRGFISQASIINAIEKYKIEETLKELGIDPDDKVLYNVIWNFFKAVTQVFKDYWGENKFLSKTIAIRAFFLIMKDTLKTFASQDKEFSVQEISNYLSKIDKKLFESPDILGLGGEKGVKMLYEKLKEHLEK